MLAGLVVLALAALAATTWSRSDPPGDAEHAPTRVARPGATALLALAPTPAPSSEAPAGSRPGSPVEPPPETTRSWSLEEFHVAVRGVVDATGEEELLGLLVETTGRSAEDLSTVRDLRGYATRLATRALSGIAGPPLEEPALPLEFALTPAVNNDPASAPPLRSSSDRIYALFPLAEGSHDQIIAKWYRAGDTELLAFDELPVQEENGWGWVSLARAEGFPAGDYRAEILSNDDAVDLIAQGDFQTREAGPPPTVVFRTAR